MAEPEGQHRVAPQVGRPDHLVAQVVGVVEGEVAAPLVEGVAELGAAGEGLELARARPEADAVVAHVHGRRLRPARETDGVAGISEHVLVDDGFGRPLVGQVDPVVEAVDGRVDRVLRVREGEAGEERLPAFGAAVAVFVGQVEDVGSGRDEYALAVGHDPRGEHEAIGEDRAPIGAAVFVPVLEQPDAPGGPCVERIARHLGHEDAAALVEVHRHRRRDLGLGREQTDREALLDAEGLEGFVRWERRGAGAPAGGKEDAAGPGRPGRILRG